MTAFAGALDAVGRFASFRRDDEVVHLALHAPDLLQRVVALGEKIPHLDRERNCSSRSAWVAGIRGSFLTSKASGLGPVTEGHPQPGSGREARADPGRSPTSSSPAPAAHRGSRDPRPSGSLPSSPEACAGRRRRRTRRRDRRRGSAPSLPGVLLEKVRTVAPGGVEDLELHLLIRGQILRE